MLQPSITETKGFRAFDLRRRQAVKLFDLGEADIDYAAFALVGQIDHLGNPVQGLRTENHIDIGRPLADCRTLLTGDTAADTNDDVGALLFEFLPAAELMKHFLLRFFAD